MPNTACSAARYTHVRRPMRATRIFAIFVGYTAAGASPTGIPVLVGLRVWKVALRVAQSRYRRLKMFSSQAQ